MSTITDFEIIRKNQTEPLIFYVRDTITGDLADVFASSTWSLINISNDATEVSGIFPPAGNSNIQRLSTGVYRYNFNATTYPYEYLFATRCVMQNETQGINIFVKSVASRQFAYAAQLRLQVDKARKSISDDIANMDRSSTSFEPKITFLFGYDDKNLIFYLERGTQYLNSIPPYTGMDVDTFPFSQYGSILIDAATIAALESQGVFAIDTDYSYQLGGNSLVIDHFTKLSTQVRDILNRFQKHAISWKQQYRAKGMVVFQWQPGGVRASRQLSALPSGFWSRMLSNVYI